MKNGLFSIICFVLSCGSSSISTASANEMIAQNDFPFEVVPEQEIDAFDPLDYPCVVHHTCYINKEFMGSLFYTVERIHGGRLKILGKGIQAKKSRQVLGLACVGDSEACDTVRFVYQANQNEIYFLGPKLRANPNYRGGSDKAIQTALKDLYKEGAHAGQRGLFTYAALTLAAFGSVFAFHVTAPAIILFMVGLAKGVSEGSMSEWPAFDALGKIKTMSKTDSGSSMTNQNGWNWAEEPTLVRENVFKELMLTLQLSFFRGDTKAVERGAIQLRFY